MPKNVLYAGLAICTLSLAIPGYALAKDNGDKKSEHGNAERKGSSNGRADTGHGKAESHGSHMITDKSNASYRDAKNDVKMLSDDDSSRKDWKDNRKTDKKARVDVRLGHDDRSRQQQGR